MQHQEQAFGEPAADEMSVAGGTTDARSSRWRRWGLPVRPRAGGEGEQPRRIWLGGGAGKAAREEQLIPRGRGRDDQGDL